MNDDTSPTRPPTARQLEHMRATGKITDEEATALASPDEAVRDATLRDIRTRHARARVEAAAAEGAVSEEEADELLRQVAGGAHSRGLRARISALMRHGRAARDH